MELKAYGMKHQTNLPGFYIYMVYVSMKLCYQNPRFLLSYVGKERGTKRSISSKYMSWAMIKDSAHMIKT